MNIGVDLDEVLADFIDSFLEYYNTRYGKSIIKAECISYNFWEIYGISKEEIINIIHDFYNTKDFENISPTIGAIEHSRRLNEKHNLFVITSRQSTIRDETTQWIEKYFPDIFQEVHLTNQFSLEGEKCSKSDICKKLNVDIMIEDNVGYAIDCARVVKRVFLINRPWNQNAELPENVIRVNNWEEIFGKIENIC